MGTKENLKKITTSGDIHILVKVVILRKKRVFKKF